MWKLKNYKIGFNLTGLMVFLLIMVPNVLWYFLPAPNDILREARGWEILQALVSFIQAVMVASVCLLINREFHPPVDAKIFAGICLCYFSYAAGWAFYYLGFTGPFMILNLCIAPSLCFFLESYGRKNGPGVLLSLAFLVLHTLWGVLSFL